ncbi:MAG: tyrosine-type recombinase/integrase [bacterium]|nr:tyrosine-type recombinase/integrase [bacterium]
MKRGRLWYARFRADGRRHEIPLKLSNKERAERKAAEINDALEKGESWEWLVDRVRPGERTFSDLATEYLDRGSRWSESTRRGNAGTIGQLLQEFGDTPLTMLSRSAIEGYLARRRDEGLGKASRNRYLASLRVILAKGVEWDYLRQNPAAGLKQESEGRKLPRPYRDGEVAALLAALDPATRDIATLYLETALRRGELMKLLWGDVDLVGASLTVRAPKNRRDRVVPLSTGALRVLTNRRHQWQQEQTDGRADLRVYGPRAEAHKAVRNAWHVLAPERHATLRPLHSFRDTAITRLVNAGVPLPVVQELAGHATIEMTRRYAEVSPEAVREAITRVFA